MLNFGHQRRRKNTNSRKHGCVCTFFDCFVHLVSNSVVFVRVPPVLTGQRAIRSPEPLSQRGQDACRSLTCNENDRHVTLHGANWQEEGSACKGSRWQIWHHASPGTVNALNNCTSHTLPLVASAGPPAITSRELHTQQTTAPELPPDAEACVHMRGGTKTADGRVKGDNCDAGSPLFHLIRGWHSWLWICNAC